jgi:hypothetical protein
MKPRSFIMIALICIVSMQTALAIKSGKNKNCTAYLNNSDKLQKCKFFSCFDENYPCGNKSFVMTWGYKYCVRFVNITSKLTPTGQRFFENTNNCLTKDFVKTYNENSFSDCKKMQSSAIALQRKCYLENQDDFCNGMRENRETISSLIDTNDLNLDLVSLFSQIANKCNPKLDITMFLG